MKFWGRGICNGAQLCRELLTELTRDSHWFPKKGMRILVMLLLDTLPMLGNVLLLCFFVFFIFGIVGVQLWAGLTTQLILVITSFFRFSSFPTFFSPWNENLHLSAVRLEEINIFCRSSPPTLLYQRDIPTPSHWSWRLPRVSRNLMLAYMIIWYVWSYDMIIFDTFLSFPSIPNLYYKMDDDNTLPDYICATPNSFGKVRHKSLTQKLGTKIRHKSKGRVTLRKRMNFQKSSKRPLTPPSFSENYVADFL